MKRSIGLLLIAIIYFAPVEAQVLDGLYVKEHTPARKPIPYTHLREADVMWSKRIWRNIDLREKMNFPLYFPEDPTNGRASLFEVIKKGVSEGSLLAFDTDDFRQQLTRTQAIDALESVVMKQTEDPNNPGLYYEVADTQRVESRQIVAYQLKEDWFFDRQRSVMDVRIIGIAPIKVTIDPTTGAERGRALVFWLYFPNCREIFANAESYNRGNDTERRTFEDIFWKRMFSSYVVKESNVYDRLISDYATGLDGLLEARRIKEQIHTLEMDLWHY
jgi:gliding motility associated protien GldN